MRRTMVKPGADDRIAWTDVWNWCADVEATWHCYIEIEQWRVRKEGFYGKWDIRVTAKWLGVGGTVTRTEAVTEPYPNNTTRSLPAHQLRLLIDLDRKLSELQREKQEGAEAQARFA